MTSPDPSLNLDALLAHSAFVRAIARALVHDEAAADDVVQETWLVALQRRPDDVRSLRSWLASVVRSIARSGWRSDQRRERRERSVAIQDPSSSESTATEILRQEEIRRRVLTAVLALHDPHRTAVLQHYFHELSLDEIARRHGTTTNTVGSWLRRSRLQLRASMDRSYDGERQSWFSGMVCLSVRNATPPTPPTGGIGAGGAGARTSSMTVTGGAALMKKLFLAVACLLIVGPVLWFCFDGSQTPSLTEPGPQTKHALVTPPSLDRGEASTIRREIETKTTTEEDAPPPITGQTVDARGVPVSGVEVRSDDESSETVMTNSGGRFELGVPHHGPFKVTFRSNDHVPTSRGQVRAGDDLQAALRSGTLVRGQVLRDLDGTPISAAEVTIRYDADGSEAETVQTDRDGRFALVSPAEAVRFEVQSDGHLPWEAVPFAPADFGLPLVVRLPDALGQRNRWLRVVDEDGGPLADVTTRPTGTRKGDDAGELILAGAWHTGNEYYVDVDAPGRMPVSVTLAHPAGSSLDQAALITLPRTVSLDGSILDLAEAPIAGASVRAQIRKHVRLPTSTDHVGLWFTPRPGQWLPAVTSDAEGRFTMRDLPRGGIVALRITHPDYHQVRVEDIELERVDTSTEPVFMKPGGRVFGTVIDKSDGTGVVAAHVIATDGKVAAKGYTTLDGSFTVEHTSDRVDVLVQAPGMLPTSVAEVDATDPKPLRIALTPGRTITGHVLDRRDRPIAGARVLADLDRAQDTQLPKSVVAQLKRRRIAWTDVSGRFSFDGLAEGTYRLMSAHGSKSQGLAQGFDTEAKIFAIAGDSTVVLRLDDMSSVTGIVVDKQTGHTIPTFLASFESDNEGMTRTWRNARGSFHLDLRPGTRHTVSAQSEGYSPSIVENVFLAPGERREILFELEPALTFSAIVHDAAGGPLPHVTLELIPNGPAYAVENPNGRSDADGKVQIEGLAPMEYLVSARLRSGPGGFTQERPIELTPDRILPAPPGGAPVVLRLLQRGADVHLTIFQDEDPRHRSTVVELRPADDEESFDSYLRRVEFEVGDRTSLMLPNLPSGAYEIYVTRSYEIADGTTRALTGGCSTDELAVPTTGSCQATLRIDPPDERHLQIE